MISLGAAQIWFHLWLLTSLPLVHPPPTTVCIDSGHNAGAFYNPLKHYLNSEWKAKLEAPEGVSNTPKRMQAEALLRNRPLEVDR